jgi:hypothetical protein
MSINNNRNKQVKKLVKKTSDQTRKIRLKVLRNKTVAYCVTNFKCYCSQYYLPTTAATNGGILKTDKFKSRQTERQRYGPTER